jgi:hypothetical protein
MKTDQAFAVWPVDELSRVFPHDVQPRSAWRLTKRGWDLAAARGEYCSFQLGIRYAGDFHDIRVSAGSLLKGKCEIPATAIQVRWAGLVPVPLDGFHAVGAERPGLAPAWYPDPLHEDVPWQGAHGPQSAALYITLYVPPDTVPGHYHGNVVLHVPRQGHVRVPVNLDVWPFVLPERPTFYVTNWLQPDCITKWHRCEPWSERHWRILELYARDMAAHRQNVIATPTLIGNFHNSDPMTLVDATRRKDGTLQFDMRRLERWVELFDRHGFELFEMWHLLSQADGKYAPPFGLFDEGKGRRVWYDKLLSTGSTYRKLVGSFLTALSRWLDQRGLAKRFLLHVFDEPKRECWPHYAKMSAFFRQKAPKLRQMDAMSTSELITGFGADLDIPVPLTPHLGDDEYFRKRAREGRKPVWWYTCCGPCGRYANRFVSMPLINGRMLFWQSFVFGITGYLHWGFNFWHRIGQNASGWPGINGYADTMLLNPYREHPSRWPVGDACIVYPHQHWWEDHGPVGSLRWETMRAGLQDYEMLRMLDALVCRTKPKPGTGTAAVHNKANGLLAAVRGPIAGSLTDFTRDAKLLLGIRRKMGECISALVQ